MHSWAPIPDPANLLSVLQGKLPCSFVTHALLGAYLAQSELGDYDPVDHGLTIDYIREFDFAPNQSEDLLERIMEVRTQYRYRYYANLHIMQYFI